MPAELIEEVGKTEEKEDEDSRRNEKDDEATDSCAVQVDARSGGFCPLENNVRLLASLLHDMRLLNYGRRGASGSALLLTLGDLSVQPVEVGLNAVSLCAQLLKESVHKKIPLRSRRRDF